MKYVLIDPTWEINLILKEYESRKLAKIMAKIFKKIDKISYIPFRVVKLDDKGNVIEKL